MDTFGTNEQGELVIDTFIEKGTPLNHWQAAILIVNEYLEEMDKLKKCLKTPDCCNLHEILGIKEELVDELTEEWIYTEDEKTNPVQMVKTAVFMVLDYHKNKGDLHTISHVIFNGWKNGEVSWTAV
jgi:hypothetical protein